MQKIIFIITFFISLYFSNIIFAQSTESLKKSIISINNKPILIKEIDRKILGKKFTPYIEGFEAQLSKKFGKQFDDCYRVIFFTDYRKPTMFIYLIPDNIDTKENWMKMKYNTKREKVYQLYYEINTKIFSDIGFRYPLPYL